MVVATVPFDTTTVLNTDGSGTFTYKGSLYELKLQN
jgi:hypothetical protein